MKTFFDGFHRWRCWKCKWNFWYRFTPGNSAFLWGGDRSCSVVLLQRGVRRSFSGDEKFCYQKWNLLSLPRNPGGGRSLDWLHSLCCLLSTLGGLVNPAVRITICNYIHSEYSVWLPVTSSYFDRISSFKNIRLLLSQRCVSAIIITTRQIIKIRHNFQLLLE